MSLHMDLQTGYCYPSTRLLAERTGLSERSVCTHLELAAAGGWISKGLRREASGQGWKRHEYRATLPKALKDVQHLTHEGTEGRSVRSGEGTEPHDIKALKEVQWNKSVNQRTTYTYPPDFERVWSIHHRGSKSAALKQWRKVVPDGISQGDLERYLMAYVKTFTGDFQGQHLFRWMRERRWEELQAGANGRARSTHMTAAEVKVWAEE